MLVHDLYTFIVDPGVGVIQYDKIRSRVHYEEWGGRDYGGGGGSPPIEPMLQMYHMVVYI